MLAPTYFPAVRVIDQDSIYHNKVVALAIDAAGIVSVNPNSPPAEAHIIEREGLCVSPGWVDLFTAVGEPGYEQRETIASLQRAAAAGGFTHIVVQPETSPAVDNRSAVVALLSRGADHPVALHVIGALSQKRAGQQLAEYGDMAAAGVQLVGDGLTPVIDAKLLQLALSYAAPLGVTIVAQPGEQRLASGGLVNEGIVSTLMGVPGIAALTEQIGLERDLRLLEYAGGSLFIPAVSLGSSVESVLAAKQAGHDIKFAVSSLHLLLTDSGVEAYDANLKVLPPLRTEPDRQRLLQAIKGGEADALVSLHRPRTLEEKQVEFAYAEFGAATLELSYAIATTALNDGILAADYLGRRNRQAAQLPAATVTDGSAADLTFFIPGAKQVVSSAGRATLAANVPLIDEELTGVVVGIACGGQYLPA